MKRAFLFPGQGAQTVGMGKDVYEKYEESRKIYDKASEISGIDVKKICFEGPEEELNKTENKRNRSRCSNRVKFRRIWSINICRNNFF